MSREPKKLAASLSIAFLLCAGSSTLNASSYSEFNKSLSSANYVSSMDGARSLGSLGSNLGLIYQQFSVPGENPFVTENFSEPVENRLVLPGIMVSKGFAWPINLGVGLSYLDKPGITKTFGYFQWTALEGFQTPALAFQISHSELSGMSTSSFKSTAASAHLSYAPVYFLTFFGSVGTSVNKSTVLEPGESERIFIRQNVEAEEFQNEAFTSKFYSIGSKLLVPSTFVSIAAEYQKADDEKVYLAKLSVGM